MKESDQDPWLGVGEASALLSVSPSTLRRWTQKELVPARTTAGGHRRYSQEAIEELARALKTSPPATQSHAISLAAPSGEWGIPHQQLQAQEWYRRFSGPRGISSMRALGQRLLGLFIQQVSRREEDPRFLDEAREVGLMHGRMSAELGATLRDVVEAFLFFRSSLSGLVLQSPNTAHSSDGEEIIRLVQVTDRFMNAVLVGIATGYESQGRLPKSDRHDDAGTS